MIPYQLPHLFVFTRDLNSGFKKIFKTGANFCSSPKIFSLIFNHVYQAREKTWEADLVGQRDRERWASARKCSVQCEWSQFKMWLFSTKNHLQCFFPPKVVFSCFSCHLPAIHLNLMITRYFAQSHMCSSSLLSEKGQQSCQRRAWARIHGSTSCVRSGPFHDVELLLHLL